MCMCISVDYLHFKALFFPFIEGVTTDSEREGISVIFLQWGYDPPSLLCNLWHVLQEDQLSGSWCEIN